MRPPYTARRREALHVVRGADGALEIGSGRLRIMPGGPGYFSRVANALSAMVDLPGSVEALDRGDALGHRLVIMPPPAATVPANAWSFAGRQAGMVVIDPADWPRPGDGTPVAAASVLYKLLWHADGGPASATAVPAAVERVEVLRLSGRPARVGAVLCFPLLLENIGTAPVWVMRGLAASDPATGGPHVATGAAVSVDEAGEALIGRYVPPPPRDRLMGGPVVPLVQRLAPGEGREVRIELPPPYAEASPFLPPPDPERLVPAELRAITVAVAWWPDGCEGAAMPAFGADLHAVAAAAAPSLARARFPVNGLHFGRRRTG